MGHMGTVGLRGRSSENWHDHSFVFGQSLSYGLLLVPPEGAHAFAKPKLDMHLQR